MDMAEKVATIIDHKRKLVAEQRQKGEPKKLDVSSAKQALPPPNSDADERERVRQQVERRQQEDTLLSRANIPKRHNHEVITGGDGFASWAEKRKTIQAMLGDGVILGLIGPRGNGKTQLGVEAIRWTIRQLRPARFVKAMTLFLEIRRAFRPDGPDEKLVVDQWIKPSLLVIDEIQERGETEWEDRMLVHIIDRRYDDEKDTILIGNLTSAEFDKSLGASIISRCQEGGGKIVCDWPSFRGVPLKEQTDETNP